MKNIKKKELEQIFNYIRIRFQFIYTNYKGYKNLHLEDFRYIHTNGLTNPQLRQLYYLKKLN